MFDFLFSTRGNEVYMEPVEKVAWEHVRWTQRPHAGYRWFTGSDPDNTNATWALLTPSFPLPGGGCRLMFTR